MARVLIIGVATLFLSAGSVSAQKQPIIGLITKTEASMLNRQKMIEVAAARLDELKVAIHSMTQAVETLSGGQCHCVAVARAAAPSPGRW